MEHLTLDEQPSIGGPAQMQAPMLGGGLPPPPQNVQLPPQMFTTAAQLLDMTDKKLMVSLRDGRKLIGVLRSWDQFANIVLQSTIERIFVPPSSDPASPAPGLFADVSHGYFLVRGENVVLLGEIDLDKDDEDPPGYVRADVEHVQVLAKAWRAREQGRDKRKHKKLAELGFEGDSFGEALT